LPDIITPYGSYTLRFKLEAVVAFLQRQGSVESLCADLGIGITTIYRWLHKLEEHKAQYLGSLKNKETKSLDFTLGLLEEKEIGLLDFALGILANKGKEELAEMYKLAWAHKLSGEATTKLSIILLGFFAKYSFSFWQDRATYCQRLPKIHNPSP
jgi:transposase